jgi:hypothetical protein
MLLLFLSTSWTALYVYNPLPTLHAAANYEFVSAGNLNVPRGYHTATLLQDGRVLVAGGTNVDKLASVEIYDPKNDSWVLAKPMSTPRSQHEAVLLNDGRVLVVGGDSQNNETSSEIYDPTAGQWSLTGSLVEKRTGAFTLTFLTNGKVLATGGSGAGGELATAEIYDPTTGQWSLTGSMRDERYGHTATLLPDGRVLVTGGERNMGESLTSTEIYNPQTGLWNTGDSLIAARHYHEAVLLDEDHVLVMGGSSFYGVSNALESAEIYTISSDTWVRTGMMFYGRTVFSATVLPDGKVLVAGGQNHDMVHNHNLAIAELFDKETGQWRATASLVAERFKPTAVLLHDGSVLIAGGDPTVTRAERFRQVMQNFLPQPDGYRFPNYGGVNEADFDLGDLRRTFGDEAVCLFVDQDDKCIPRPTALQWLASVHRVMVGGHCDGMAVTSLRFFTNADNPTTFQSDATTTYDLELANARKNIAYYFARQMTIPVGLHKNKIRQLPPSEILDQLRTSIAGVSADPVTIFVRQNGSGHAITPYAITDESANESRVWVYDNNHPSDAERYISIDPLQETWHYNLGTVDDQDIWKGDIDTKSLGIVPISLYNQSPHCPWCRPNLAQVDQRIYIWPTGAGQIVLENDTGQRIGYIDDQYIDTLGDADAFWIDGGLGHNQEPIYTLPATHTVKIRLSGAAPSNVANTDAVTKTINQFGSNYSVTINNLMLDASVEDALQIAADGSQIVYEAGTRRSADFIFRDEDATQSLQVELVGVDIGAQQAISTTLEMDGSVKLSYAEADAGVYGLSLTRITAAGDQHTTVSNISIAAGTTHTIATDAITSDNGFPVQIDEDSDGTIDTVIVINGPNRTYLPMVVK